MNDTYRQLLDKADKLICESVGIEHNENDDSMNESIAGAIGTVMAPLAISVIYSIVIACYAAYMKHVQLKKDARSAIAIDRDELKAAIELLKSKLDDIVDEIKSKLPKICKDNPKIIEFYKTHVSNFTHVTDYDSKSSFNKGRAAYYTIPLAKINFMRYSEALGKEEKFASVNVATRYITDETEKIAKIFNTALDRIRSKNEVLKLFHVRFYQMSGSHGIIGIESEYIVSKSSKYLK